VTSKVELSVVVPVGNRCDITGALAAEYLTVLKTFDKQFELVFVLDGEHPEIFDALVELADKDRRVRIIQLARNFGEAAALTAGFTFTSGSIILTLPAYYQIEAGEIHKMIAAIDQYDVVVGTRWPRARGSRFESARHKVFHWLVRIITGDSFSDLGCGARVLKRQVVDEVPIYGDQHRFIPLLALRRGFHVHELIVKQSAEDEYKDGYGLRVYLRRLLDILTVVFLVRFTKKPLRFFGTIGSITFSIGAFFLFYIVIERLFFDVALADRPALLLSSLLVVLGLQILALGLLGELIIFTHAPDIKEYSIEKIVN